MRSPLLAGILLISLLLVCAVGVVFLLRSTVTAAPIEALPGDTSFLVRVQNPAEFWRGLSLSALAAAGDGAPDAAIDMITPALTRRGIPVPSSARAILGTYQRELLLAEIPGDANTPAGLVLIIDLGAAGHGFPHQARQVFGEGAQEAWTTRSHHGHEYQTMRAMRKMGGRLHVAQAKGLGLVATTGAGMRRVLDTLDDRAESLVSDPWYRATRDKLGRRAALLGWVSSAWAADRLERSFGEPAERRTLRLLGLEAVKGVGLEVDLRGGQFRERMFIAMSGERRGLPAELMTGAARAHRASHLVPASFPFHLSVSCSNLDAVYRRLPEILASSTGGDRRELRSRLEGAETFMALDFATGLFAALGDELVVGFGRNSPWPRGAADRRLLQTQAVASISVVNRSTIAGFLDRVDGLARALSSYETLQRGERVMTSYNLPALAPLRPAWWLTAGRLVAGTSPAILESTLDAGAHRESWADLPGIEELIGRLPDRSHALLLADTSRAADLLGVADRQGAFAGAFTGNLPPIAISARMTSSGLLVDAAAPVSPSWMLALALVARDQDSVEPVAAPQSPEEQPIPY